MRRAQRQLVERVSYQSPSPVLQLILVGAHRALTRKRPPKGRLALSKAHAYAASLGHTPNASRFEVLTCLPVAPELPLRGSADFGTSAFFGLLSDKPLLACTLLHGVSDAKHNGWSKKLTRTCRAGRLFGINHPIGGLTAVGDAWPPRPALAVRQFG